MWTTLLLLMACQEPFGADRHDLRGFRIAALTATRAEGFVVPRVAIVEDGRPWGDGGLTLGWAWIEEPGDSVGILAFDAEGPSPRLTPRTDRLALVARRGNEERTAELALAGVDGGLEVTLGARISDRRLPDVGDEDLTLEARARWSTSPGRAVPEDGFARFTLDGSASPDVLGRFMATAGTWLELDGRTADWTPGHLMLDDGEIVEREPGDPGVITALGLALDGSRAGFDAADLAVGPLPTGLWVGGRLLPADMDAVGPSWVTLRADDAAPSGLRAEDPVPAEPNATWDPEQAGCVGVSGTFQPTWLLEAACARSALDGARVLVVAE